MLELPRVLVVDPDAAVLCEELARLGLEAQGAQDANDALTCLRTDAFDLVLVEMNLPGLSGVGLLRRLVRMGSDVPFVGLSAEPSTDDLVQLIRGGAVDFLVKPFRASDVEDVLERLARSPRARRAQSPARAVSAASSPGARAPTAAIAQRAQTREPRAASSANWRAQARDAFPLGSGRHRTQERAHPPGSGRHRTQERDAYPPGSGRHRTQERDAYPPGSGRHRTQERAYPPGSGRHRTQERDAHPPGSGRHRTQERARTDADLSPLLARTAEADPRSPAPPHFVPMVAPVAPPVPQRHEDPMQDMLLRLREGEVELPAIAPIANEIQDLLDCPDSGVDEVVKVVSQDPGIVAGVLRLANSGRYGTSKGISDLRTACLRLGNARVLALAQQLVVGGQYVLTQEPFGRIASELWRNTLVCARGARRLAGLLDVEDREALFVGAMLHNVGELALLRVLSELPDRLQSGRRGLDELSRVLSGAHEEFGGALLKRWRMPPRFVRIANAHHAPPRGPEGRVAKQQRLIAMVAWTVALREGYVYLPDQQPPELQPLLDELGLPLDKVNDAFAGCRRWVAGDGTLD